MPQVEFLVLANHAEAVNGLLYISGGGWTEHWRNVQPGQPLPPSTLGVAVGILVPWNETNRRHRLIVRVEGEDGQAVVPPIEGEFEMGRPPGFPPGIDQRSVLAINANLQFPSAGGYRVVAECGDHVRSVSFRVHDSPAQPRPA